MNLKLLFIVLGILSMAGSVSRLAAFSAGGHQFVGLVAYDQLSPADRAKVLTLIRSHPRYQEDFIQEMPSGLSGADRDRWIFCQASIWPDHVKSVGPAGKPYDKRLWHYINLPIYLEPGDEAALKNKLGANLESKWDGTKDDDGLNAIQALDRISRQAHASNVSKGTKAVNVCWAFHLVGDLHQPLHTTALFSRRHFKTGDHGGNDIDVKSSRIGGTISKLHSYWDGLLGRNIGINDLKKRIFEATQVPSIVQEAVSRQNDLDPWHWAEEGTYYAKEAVYVPELLAALKSMSSGSLRAIQLPSGYASRAGEVARLRATVGGYRLARYLESLVR